MKFVKQKGVENFRKAVKTQKKYFQKTTYLVTANKQHQFFLF